MECRGTPAKNRPIASNFEVVHPGSGCGILEKKVWFKEAIKATAQLLISLALTIIYLVSIRFEDVGQLI